MGDAGVACLKPYIEDLCLPMADGDAIHITHAWWMEVLCDVGLFTYFAVTV